MQRHVNAAIAYHVWEYHEITADDEFLQAHGAELLLEIARFWASLAALDVPSGRYMIRGVVGPDEFHDAYPNSRQPGIDNNADTNVMAVWSLARALEVLELLPRSRREELCAELALEQAELAHWEQITRRMYVRNLAPYARWGFLGQERPIVDPISKRALGRYDVETRRRILKELVERRETSSIADYLRSVDHGISRQQALAELTAYTGIEPVGQGRGAGWRCKSTDGK